jgi:ATP-dependent Clp protease protease subunit
MTTKTISKSPIPLKEEDLPFIWVNEFDGKVATDFSKKIVEFESDPDVSEIFIHIASYGGEIYPLLSMIDMMHSCKTPVHTVCSGFAMSAGGVLLLTGPGTRWMAKNSYLHIHHVRSWSYGDLPEQEQLSAAYQAGRGQAL